MNYISKFFFLTSYLFIYLFAWVQLSLDMEKALHQQVMSLTPDQFNQLPPDQRNQVLQFQQMLRQ